MEYPALEIEIKDEVLAYYKCVSDGKYLPEILKARQINYESIKAFFENRLLDPESMIYKEGFVRYKEKLYSLGADKGDMSSYIKNTCGNNNLDNYWFWFEGSEIQTFEELLRKSVLC